MYRSMVILCIFFYLASPAQAVSHTPHEFFEREERRHEVTLTQPTIGCHARAPIDRLINQVRSAKTRYLFEMIRVYLTTPEIPCFLVEGVFEIIGWDHYRDPFFLPGQGRTPFILYRVREMKTGEVYYMIGPRRFIEPQLPHWHP